MEQNILLIKSYDFALDVFKTYKYLCDVKIEPLYNCSII